MPADSTRDTRRLSVAFIQKHKPHPRLIAGGAVTIGGGGGTVHPPLSRRPGLCLHPHLSDGADAERVIPPFRWNPSTHPGLKVHGEPMSLYRAGLRLALFLPLGVAMPLSEKSAVRFHRCELRYQPTLADRRDP